MQKVIFKGTFTHSKHLNFSKQWLLKHLFKSTHLKGWSDQGFIGPPTCQAKANTATAYAAAKTSPYERRLLSCRCHMRRVKDEGEKDKKAKVGKEFQEKVLWTHGIIQGLEQEAQHGFVKPTSEREN